MKSRRQRNVFVIALKREIKKGSGQGKSYSRWVAEEKMLDLITHFQSSAMKFKTEIEADSYVILFTAKYREYFGQLEVVRMRG